jgi:hypothetical protein
LNWRYEKLRPLLTNNISFVRLGITTISQEATEKGTDAAEEAVIGKVGPGTQVTGNQAQH